MQEKENYRILNISDEEIDGAILQPIEEWDNNG